MVGFVYGFSVDEFGWSEIVVFIDKCDDAFEIDGFGGVF